MPPTTTTAAASRDPAVWPAAVFEAFDAPPRAIKFSHLRTRIKAFPVPHRDPRTLAPKRDDSLPLKAIKEQAVKQWYQEKLFLIYDNGSSKAWSDGRMDEGMVSVECKRNMRRVMVVFW